MNLTGLALRTQMKYMILFLLEKHLGYLMLFCFPLVLLRAIEKSLLNQIRCLLLIQRPYRYKIMSAQVKRKRWPIMISCH